MPTTTVSTNSTTPIPMSAERYVPVASPNWFAMMLARVSPGPKMCALMCCELPMSSATAIVSPIARPRPIITADDHAAAAVREHRAPDHLPRVAPSPYDASFSGCGVVANTSRVIDVMIGVIMIATMIPAVM